jgi:hypothetical protein
VPLPLPLPLPDPLLLSLSVRLIVPLPPPDVPSVMVSVPSKSVSSRGVIRMLALPDDEENDWPVTEAV